jgi:hypothetical protein
MIDMEDLLNSICTEASEGEHTSCIDYASPEEIYNQHLKESSIKMSQDNKRLIVLGNGNLQQMFVGNTVYPHDVILAMMKDGVPIGLTEARIFQHLIINMMSPQGPVTSVNTKIVPFPLDMSGGEIWIKATEYIDPNSSRALSTAISSMLATCNQIEQEARAKDAGIVLSDKMPKD